MEEPFKNDHWIRIPPNRRPHYQLTTGKFVSRLPILVERPKFNVKRPGRFWLVRNMKTFGGDVFRF